MRTGFLCGVVAASLMVSTPQRAVGQLYDDFNAATHLIDVNKWGGFETEGRGAEAHRRIDAGKLRITARGAGLLAATPTGRIFSDFGLYHPNPDSVTLLQATIEVVDFDAVSCPGNSTPSDARAIVRGNFFNSGTPTPGSFLNDVIAGIQLIRRANAPANTVAVEAFAFRCTNATCATFVNLTPVLTLGTPLACPGRICPPVTVRVTWEKAAHRFRFLRVGATEQIMPYALADANFASRTSRTLSVAPVLAACTAAAGRKTASMDALFDNVIANGNPGANVDALFVDEIDAIDLGELSGPGEAPVP
ncbi:MAG TPA: hypothetical protein VNN62_24910 [Methylomirabilota bacterium]|nr:hypothetical protein [Methylomirabilota bacterium]